MPSWKKKSRSAYIPPDFNSISWIFQYLDLIPMNGWAILYPSKLVTVEKMYRYHTLCLTWLYGAVGYFSF